MTQPAGPLARRRPHAAAAAGAAWGRVAEAAPATSAPNSRRAQIAPRQRGDRPADFAALVLPGGIASPDKLRLVPEAIAFVQAIAAVGKPIAAICHGPWTLIEAGVVAGKSLTSWPSLQTDISNAGGDWHDEPVLLCSAMGFDLVTSRKPDDLDAFNVHLVRTFARAA